MKVLWLYRVYADVNTHITTWRETDRHLKQRHEIHYIFACRHSRQCFTDQATLIPKLPRRGLAFLHFLLAGFGAFRRQYRALQPDLVIFDQFTILYSLMFLGAKQRPAFVLDLRQAKYSNAAAWHSGRLMRAYTKCVLGLNRDRHEGITYISEGLRQQLLRDMRMPLNPRQLIWPSGVDPDLFRPDSGHSSSSDAAELRLFFHGSLTDGRGLAETIRAMRLLRERAIPASFTVVGDGTYLDTLRRLAAELEVEDRVHFRPLVPFDQVPALIAEAEICMMAYPLTDFWEGNVPIKLLEYMSMQKVVLTTPVRAFRTITEDASCAHFIADNTPASIAGGVEYLYWNRAHLRDWGRAGRDIVQRRYTWKAIADDLDKFLTETVNYHHRKLGLGSPP